MTTMFKEQHDYYAWYMYPEPAGREYTEQDLENADLVREVFDYCQIALASISDKGWQKLIQYHGLDELLKINHISGWFDDSSRIDTLDGIKHACLTSGYNPESDEYGVYDNDSGLFTTETGQSISITWATEWTPKY